MRKIITFSSILIILSSLCIFLFLGLISPVGRIFLAIVGIAIVFSVFKCRDEILIVPSKGITVLLLFLSFYCLITIGLIADRSYGNVFGNYMDAVCNLGIYYLGLYLATKTSFSNKHLILLFIAMLVATFARFQIERELILLESDGNETQNVGYAFVALLPYLLLFKNKIIPSLFIPLFIYALLMCSKRGAILTGGIFIIYFLYSKFIKDSQGHRFRNSIYLLVSAFAIVYISLNYFYQNEYLMHRYESTLNGNTNGRSELYEAIWEGYKYASIPQTLFGFGLNGSKHLAGNIAHNDWLELLANMGFIGVFIYSYFYISVLRFIRTIQNKESKIAMYSIILIMLLMSLYSQSYLAVSNMPMLLLFGYLVGKEHNNYYQLEYE